MMMNYPGPGFWVVSQLLLLVYFKMDNGSNVCGIEFNYNSKNGEKENGEEGEEEEKNEGEKEEEEEKNEGEEEEQKDDLISIIGSDLANNERNYNAEILRQLFLDFQVKSEEGR